MLSVPPPTRIAIGTVEIAGKRFEVFISTEWARYFQQLNTQTLSNASDQGATQPHAMLLDDATEAPDVFPGPPGPQGTAGGPGLALFLLQDPSEEQAVLMPPASSYATLATSPFACNGQALQGSAAVNAAATDLASVIALCNQLRAALIANGIAT
jgi:hypothetical protein